MANPLLALLGEPVGHLDQQRWTPAPAVVVKVDDGQSVYVSACQRCRELSRTDDLGSARRWLDEHVCGESGGRTGEPGISERPG
jgi:hypothetical protein